MNLPELKLSFFENLYEKLVGSTLSKIDDGSLFKSFITTLISLFAYVVLVSGVWSCLVGISDSFNALGGEGIDRFTAFLGLLIGIILGILVPWALYRIIKKRSDELNAEKYSGILDYFFKKTMPKIITILGELLFVGILAIGLATIIATLISSSVYISFSGGAAETSGVAMGLLNSLSDLIANVPLIDGLPYADAIGDLTGVSGEASGSWANFMGDMHGGIALVINSFIVVIYFYIIREVYNFGLSLITTFLKFLPKLAIPLAIRNK